MFSTILHQRSKTFSGLLRTRIFTREMGGGPRTFPGGLNKWQWKRLHEKKAKEKEKRLLDQEKQLYQARIRSQIRAKLSGKDDPSSNTANYDAMSPNDHIKALADRFMREGAEDLWNENDVPLKLEDQERPRSIVTARNQRSGSIPPPLDVKKLISDNHRGNATLGGVNSNNFGKNRSYSVQSNAKFRVNESSFSNNIERKRFNKNGSSSTHHESDLASNDNSLKRFGRGGLGGSPKNENSGNLRKFVKGRNDLGRKRFRRNDSSSSDDSDLDLEDEVEGRRDVMKLGSSACLGKYDTKVTKRVPLKNLEMENDFSQQVEFLRKELEKKKLAKIEGKKGEGETIYSQKR